jgi:hypothetical protein
MKNLLLEKGVKVVKRFGPVTQLLKWNEEPFTIYVPKISAKEFSQLRCLSALELAATDAAHLSGLTHRKSVNVIFLKIRARIAEEGESHSPLYACSYRGNLILQEDY